MTVTHSADKGQLFLFLTAINTTLKGDITNLQAQITSIIKLDTDIQNKMLEADTVLSIIILNLFANFSIEQMFKN